MSNEYKDWEMERLQEERDAIAKYPFVATRDIDGTVLAETETEFPMICLEIPNGWHKLFYQMCDDIKAILEKEDTVNDFYFSQVKEKYNTLVCYHNGSNEIEDIIEKYSHISRYICTVCGKPATVETSGYIASFCDDCKKEYMQSEGASPLNYVDRYQVVGFKHGSHYTKTIDTSSEWDRYLAKLVRNKLVGK